MTLVVIYKYKTFTIDKLLALALAVALALITNYVTNCSKMVIYYNIYQLLFQTIENRPISGTYLAQ